MRPALLCALLAPLAIAPAGGCTKKTEREKAEEASAKSIAPVGVLPDQFRCDSIAPTKELEAILGGTVELQEGMLAPPAGTAAPCNYLVTTAAGQQAWTFDIDCRPTAVDQTEQLITQYRVGNQKLIDSYNAASDGGTLEIPDGGPVPTAPEASREVQVGRKALDHHGQGLIFLDDDAPCHVRIVGQDADRRLALAQLVARNLTEATAPMDPRFRRAVPPPK